MGSSSYTRSGWSPSRKREKARVSSSFTEALPVYDELVRRYQGNIQSAKMMTLTSSARRNKPGNVRSEARTEAHTACSSAGRLGSGMPFMVATSIGSGASISLASKKMLLASNPTMNRLRGQTKATLFTESTEPALGANASASRKGFFSVTQNCCVYGYRAS